MGTCWVACANPTFLLLHFPRQSFLCLFGKGRAVMQVSMRIEVTIFIFNEDIVHHIEYQLLWTAKIASVFTTEEDNTISIWAPICPAGYGFTLERISSFF
jgi:hypothetical protein